MWISQPLFDHLIANSRTYEIGLTNELRTSSSLNAQLQGAKEQKAKDDLHIDWLRHRVNALEKQNGQLLMKVTGMPFAVPEIVPTRPGTMSAPPQFDTMPSFEDVGDEEANRLGLSLDDHGQLQYSGTS